MTKPVKTEILSEVIAIESSPMQKAIDEYRTACNDLEVKRIEARNLRTRISELDCAILDIQQSAKANKSIASLSIEQIRKLSAEKSAAFNEVSGLQCAKDIALTELKGLEDERAIQIWINDSRPVGWAILYNELLTKIDLSAIHKLITVGLEGRVSRERIIRDLGLEDMQDALMLESLSTELGLPL